MNTLHSKTVLVTGGFGYIGSHICESLLLSGYKVTILAKKIPEDLQAWAKRYQYWQADLLSPQELYKACEGIHFVIHTAALNSSDSNHNDELALQVNAWGTRNILEEALRAKVKHFYYLSTFHIYGAAPAAFIHEGILPIPTNNYGLTHYFAELYCTKYQVQMGLKTTSLRISNAYGAPLGLLRNCWALAMNDFCLQAAKNKKIILRSSGQQKRDFVSIFDIIQALKLLMSKEDTASTYNVGGDQILSILDIADQVKSVYEELHQISLPIEVHSNPNITEKFHPYQYDISRIKGLGYRPHHTIKKEIKTILLNLL